MEDLFGEVSRDTYYDHTAGKRYCEMLGLQWDEKFAMRADKMAREDFGLSQAGFNLLVYEYAWKVAWMMCPRVYPWRTRIAIALRFLNPFVQHVQVTAAKKFQDQKET